MRSSDGSSDVCSSDLLVDPRPYCEIARQWATFHPEFNWLPRKFKLAFSATTGDRAATRTHDIGIHIVRNERGELGYTMYVGGGLGRMPMLGHKIRDRSEEHTSELQSLMRISYAVFCLKKKTIKHILRRIT